MPCSLLAFRGGLSLLRSPRLDRPWRGRDRRFQLPVSLLLGKTKFAQPGRLERHGLVLALLIKLEGRFPLLSLAQKGLGIAPCGGCLLYTSPKPTRRTP